MAPEGTGATRGSQDAFRRVRRQFGHFESESGSCQRPCCGWILDRPPTLVDTSRENLFPACGRTARCIIPIDMPARTPRQIIDQAVAENRFGERLLYGMACAFAGIGLFVLIWAAINRLAVIAVTGSISTALFWPAVKSARQTRKENIAIRLLEAPLSRADTAKEAAEMVRQFFHELMLDSESVRAKSKAALRSS
jgi:hypothetical protein